MNLFYYTLKNQLKLKALVITQVLILLCAIFLGMVFSNYQNDFASGNQIKLGVINFDNDKMSHMLIENFKGNPQFTSVFQIVDGDEELVKRKFENSEIDSYVVIPKGFADGLMHYENQKLDFYSHSNNPTKNMLLRHIFQSYSKYVQATNIATIALYSTMEDANLSDVKKESANNIFSLEMISAAINRDQYFEKLATSELPLVDGKRYFLFAIPLSFIAFTTLSSGINFKRDRENALSKRIILCTGSKTKYLATEISAQVLNTLLAFIPVFIAQAVLLSISDMMLGILVSTICTTFFTMLWRILSYYTKDVLGMSVISYIASFIMSILGGAIVPYTILPASIKNLGSFSPIFHFLKLSLPFENAGAGVILMGASIWAIVILIEFIAEFLLLKASFKR